MQIYIHTTLKTVSKYIGYKRYINMLFGAHHRYEKQIIRPRHEVVYPKPRLLLFIGILIVPKLSGNEVFKNKDQDGSHVG